VPDLPRALGLIVLQADETLEGDFRTMLPADVPLYVSRVPSAPEVTPDTLAAMAAHLTGSAALLPAAAQFASIGYGCTSGAAEIGSEAVAGFIRQGAAGQHVTDPLDSLVAACGALGIRRLALLSPYVATVSEKLRSQLASKGISTPVFGSFDESREAQVVRIDAVSILRAAVDLAGKGGTEAVFLSCTNLRTLALIEEIEARTGLACFSSNQVLGWHMARSAGLAAQIPGRLNRCESAAPAKSASR
jgi:maleate isomerase